MFRATPIIRRVRMNHVPILCAVMLLFFLVAGCGDYCIIVTGIVPNTSSSTNLPSCQLPTTTGTVSIRINSIAASSVAASSGAASSGAALSPNLAHIFVSLRGIDGHTDELGDANSLDWKGLAPELASQPVQFDLMDSQAADGPSCALGALRANHIPAGSYRQVRLQLVSDHPDSSEPVPQHNECAGIGFNCVVGNNGEKHALVLDGAGQFLEIAPTRIANGFFNVIADTETRLSIAFDSYSSLAAPAGDAVRITPVFSIASATAAATCDSLPPSP